MRLCDFHIHSNFSDGVLSIPEIIDFYGVRKFSVIAITDHICEQETILGKAANYLRRTLTPANFPLYLEIIRSESERAMKQYGMLVISGVELTKNHVSNSRSAHLIGLGVSEFISADLSIEDSCYRIREQGGLVIAAHPVSNKKFEKQTLHLWDRREELRPLIDAWEVATGQFFSQEVKASGLPLIASSDLHHPSQIRSWKTHLKCELHQDSVFSAIRCQDLSFEFFEGDNTYVH